MPGYERDNEENSGWGGGLIIGLVGAGLAAVTAALTLQTQKEKNYDNERQREHERDMARRSETNPSISVQTGRVDINHWHHGETTQFTPATFRKLENHGMKALKQ